MQRTLLGTVLLVLACSSANAALLSRLSGQAYYDDVLSITWLADANTAATNTFGVTGIDTTSPSMTWHTAGEWIAAMNSANYLSVDNWRLPKVIDTGAPGCDYANIGTDCGFNVDTTTGEMAHLYYVTLGNQSGFDASGNSTGCPGPESYCLTNVGPFSNFYPAPYWAGTEYATDSSRAWFFNFSNGAQADVDRALNSYAWAVRDGDIGVVPIPASAWLLATGVAGLGGRRWLRRKAA